mmetsp:Transcript_20475/g.52589  ORF Transcript_20475/g.52589 Transcript_20475/m.52589 type:complete len:539 (-) Transcript_20475:262-1878(-)|eukprot:CAMPEP_0113906844 /NCGR_PEP_ID=MMETSP0780_2-20120614/25054_1 /TAXON_ID=652834 /ORGANISM="Palpitomonas bilix" /LENGTH=538 /DNA_ID=CAMNT_0000901651 /DNA_START=290 /DNA_END=1906 /DNA_ORIENTATION=- /assembly_acc=CAM_ASM_000599
MAFADGPSPIRAVDLGAKRLRKVSNNFFIEPAESKSEISSIKSLIEVEQERKSVASVSITPVVLFFRGPKEFESGFRNEYALLNLVFARYAWLGWCLVLALFAVFDHLGFPFSFFPVFFSTANSTSRFLGTPQQPERLLAQYLVRFSGSILIGLLMFGLSFAKFFQKHMQWLVALACFFHGACLIALQGLCDRYEYGVMIIFLFFVNFFSRLFFLPAAVVSLSLFFGFIATYIVQLTSFPGLSLSRYLINDAGLSLLAILAMLYVRYVQERKLRKEFLRHTLTAVEEKKTQVLLSALLPLSVAEQLSRGEHGSIVDIAPDTTLLFLDIVSFTKLSSGITSTQLMAMLNNVYSTFDDLADKYSVYKVETIGDAYIAVSGLQRISKGQKRDYACSIADMAIAMIEAIPAINERNMKLIGQEIQIRVGIHTGPSIAGVLGLKMPRYHLWGEAITIANSLQEGGAANQILVSGATQEILGDSYLFEEFDCSSSNKVMVDKAFWLKGKNYHSTRHSIGSERASAPLPNAIQLGDSRKAMLEKA